MTIAGVWLFGGAVVGPGRTATDNVLRVEMSSEFDSLDPTFAYSPISWQLEYATCEKLFDYPDREGRAGTQLVPEASDGWPRVSADGMTYVFRIRPRIRSNLGHELTAANFATTIKRVLNPRSPSPGAFYVDGSRGPGIASVAARGRILTIYLDAPYAGLPAVLSTPFFCAEPTGLPPDPVETPIESWGPYYVAAGTRLKLLTLAVNPNYRGQRLHRPAKIVYSAGPLPNALLTDIEHGGADYTPGELPADAYGDLAARYGVNRTRFFMRPTMSADYLF